MSTESICPCDAFNYPLVIDNPAGLTAIQYRVGAYADFRHAMLLSRPGESALVGWRPGAYADLGVQMVEWWAYLADILTFYNERIANESYLQTAVLPESVQDLVQLLGYRPRPGIGAQGTVAALLTTGTQSVTLPVGFQLLSKPAPGQQPQTFEVSAQTTISAPALVMSDPPPNKALYVNGGVLLKGVISSIKPADSLLLVDDGWANYQWITVAAVVPEVSPRGQTNTRITFTPAPTFSGDATGYRLLRNLQSTQLFQMQADQITSSSDTVITFNSTDWTVDLGSLVRGIHAGDMVLLTSSPITELRHIGPEVDETRGALGLESGIGVVEKRRGVGIGTGSAGGQKFTTIQFTPIPALAQVSNSTELVWTVTIGSATSPMLAPHTELTLSPLPNAAWNNQSFVNTTTVQYEWRDAGEIIYTPVASLDQTDTSMWAAAGSSYPELIGQTIQIEAADGTGIFSSATVPTAGTTASLTTAGLANPPPALFSLPAPLNALLGLVPVTRGKTVVNEVLGSGDASVAGQSFTLQNSPLTYLLSSSSSAVGSYQSTLQVWVNGIEWTEVPSFYGQPANAKVFVTREDSQNITWIYGGDGVNGVRFPTGTGNIIANYRYGSGAAAPSTGTLTVVSRPYPGLKSILNPVAVGGGADPDSPTQIRSYGPQSILAFGRAVSGDDYETIAAQAPGVQRAKAYWSWDGDEQRAVVTIYVGDDSNAVNAAQTALNGKADPNRPMAVKLATPIPMAWSINVTADPTYAWANIVSGIQTALADPNIGLLGTANVQIGQVIYKSQISQAVMSVPGVIEADFRAGTPIRAGLAILSLSNNFRYDPGMGNFYTLTPGDVFINQEGSND